MKKHGDEKERGFVQIRLSTSSWRERRQYEEGLGQMKGMQRTDHEVPCRLSLGFIFIFKFLL